MKIGINASYLRKQNTGIGQVTINFIKKLVEECNEDPALQEHQFFLFLEEDVELALPSNFQKVIFLPTYKRDDLIRKIYWEMIQLPQKISQKECHAFISLYQSPTILKRFFGKQRIKHFMVVHDLIPKLFPFYLNNWRKKVYQKLIERAILRTDKIISISHRTEKDLVQQLSIDPKKISVSYIDVDDIYKNVVTKDESERVCKKYQLPQSYIYTGGGLEVRKNTESVLRAYKILLEAYGHASWLPKIVVSGKMMPQLAPLIVDIEQVVEGLNLKEDVLLLDFVPQQDLPAIYRNAALFVYPSLYEGFGLPVLEAMNQGTPVITSKKSSMPEVGSDAVLYCDPTNVDDLAMVMKNVLMNNHLQSSLSLKGRERAKHFNWKKFIQKLLHIINEIK